MPQTPNPPSQKSLTQNFGHSRKSRLIAELQEQLQSQPHVRIRYFCSPQHTDSALYPIINQLERAARFERGDAPGQKLHKLQTLIAPAVPKQAAEVALLADLLS